MKLTLSNKVVKSIENEAVSSFPKDCRGVLIGDSKTGEVKEARPLEEGIFQVGDDMVVGFYHSHPNGGSEPTKDDMKEFKGMGEKPYVILSFDHGKPESLRAWKSDHGELKREGLLIAVKG